MQHSLLNQVKDRANGEFARVQGLARKMALNLGVDGAKLNSTMNNMKYVLRGMPIIIFPFTFSFPSVSCHIFLNNTTKILLAIVK